jgi:N-acetylglutamate synthase-like GNAT family acetyltransferase
VLPAGAGKKGIVMLLNDRNITLRQAGAGDWPAIAALLRENALPLEGAQANLATFIVATSGQEVVGVAGAEVHGDLALLRSVAVAPVLHGKGLGEALLRTLLDEARRRSIRQVFLLTTTAADYFARFGFRKLSREHAPRALQASAELQGACPDSATMMVLPLVEIAKADANLPVAVLGAGPVGLAAAARLIERGIEPLVLEAADSVGASLLDYGHVRLFSPWRYDIDPAMAAMLQPFGWRAPADTELPLAREVVERVLQPFSALPQVAPHLRLRTRVTSIARQGFDKVRTAGRQRAPFVIATMQDGRPLQFKARAVIDATGTWTSPNPVGANGLAADGEREHADRIFYGIPDVLGRERRRYAGKRTLVVGAGHSAANALLGLAELARAVPGTRLAWAVRSPALTRVFGGGSADALPARGRLGSDLRRLRDEGGLDFFPGMHVTAIGDDAGRLVVEGHDRNGKPMRIAGIDEIVCATGQRPDLSIASELRLRLDPWLESTEALGPLIDPNLHSCGTVRPHGHRELAHPESGFYTVGVKSYGRAPTFLMATGFEQVRSVVAAIAGDLQTADRVELDLPETGVCGVGVTLADDAGSTADAGCCGGPSQADALACCALDETAKAQGAAGCGCGDPVPAAAPAKAAGCCGAPAAARKPKAGCCG